MATIVGVECSDGALLAGDRVRTRDGRVLTRDAEHVFDLGSVGAAATGGDPDSFGDALRAGVRSYRFDRGDPSVTALASLAADRLSPDQAALVAARDDEGRPRVRAVDAGGTVPADPVAARGSGTEFALGALAFDAPPSLRTASERVAAAFESVAERDPGTGADIDCYRLAADSGAGR